MPDINMQVFEEAKRNQLVTEVDIQTQAALDDYQVQLSDIANPTQSQDNIVIDRFGEFLPHWNESFDFDTWVKMSMEVTGKQILMLRGNSSVSGVSSISNTFPILADDFEGDLSNWDETGTPDLVETQSVSPTHSVYLDSTGTEAIKQVHTEQSGTYIIEYDFRLTVVNQYFAFYTYDNGVFGVNIETYSGSLQYYDGSYHNITSISANTWYHVKIIHYTATNIFDCYIDDMDTAKVTGANMRGSPTATDILMFRAGSDEGFIDDVFIRKYTENEPTWRVDGGEQNIAIALKSLGRAG